MAVYQGIDPGNSKIRRITVKSGLGGFSTAGKQKPRRKIMTVPSYLLTFRQFIFPFQDKKRIRDILPGELMDSLAYSLEDVIWDISSTDQHKARTVVIPRDYLDQFLKSHGNSVQVIDAEPCALARVAGYNGIREALILDMGAHKTAAVGVANRRVEMLRVRLMGGNHLDKVISSRMNLGIEAARTLKEQKGLELPPVKEFLDEMFNSLSLPSLEEYEAIIITGGTSKLPGLEEYLTERFSLPVKKFELPGGLDPQLDAVALGAALYYSVGDEKVNLKEKKESEKKSTAPHWLLLLLLPLILFSVNIKSQEKILEKEQAQLRNAQVALLRKEFPDIGRIVSPLNQARGLIGTGSASDSSPTVETLESLSIIARARRGMEVNFYEMDFAEREVKLKGESDSFQTVDQLRGSLAKEFAGAEILEQKTKPNGKVDFYIKVDNTKSEKETQGTTDN